MAKSYLKWKKINSVIYLKKISKIILFCAKNNLPLRSSDKVDNDNCVIFLLLFKMNQLSLWANK